MKKAKPALKKLSDNKSKAAPKASSTKLVGRMKSLAKDLVKAMAPKADKKAVAKVAAKSTTKVAPKAEKNIKKGAVLSGKAHAPQKAPLVTKDTKKDLGKGLPLPKEKTVDSNSGKSSKSSPSLRTLPMRESMESPS